MNTSVQSLQEGAIGALTELVHSFEERWEVEAETRAKEHEFVDETEVLISFGKIAFDEIYDFLKEEGAWVPSSFGDPLQEAARKFLGAYTLQEDQQALDAKAALYKGFEGFRECLIAKGYKVG